jgi:hypothetical protein
MSTGDSAWRFPGLNLSIAGDYLDLDQAKAISYGITQIFMKKTDTPKNVQATVN